MMASTAFMHLGPFDRVLDALLLVSPLLWICPPLWTFVTACNIETETGAAGRMNLIALLPAKTACKAS